MKVFIIHATAGAGHKKAAEALYNSFRKINPDKNQVQNIDALDYTNAFFKRAYPEVYIFLVSYVPWLWGIIFHLLNSSLLKPIINPIRSFFNSLQGAPLLNYVKEQQPDVIICEHFMSAQLMAALKTKGLIKAMVVCGVTDFGVHQFWVNKGIDFYLVASESTKEEIISMGVKADKIRVTGIPIEDKFSKITDRNQLFSKLGLKQNKFTVLVTSGGFGVGPIKKIVEHLDNMSRDLQIAVVCGKNADMYDYFKAAVFKKNVQANGFINNMDEFMECADLIISKSGGLTVSESLAKNLPMLIIKPIPGQETRNAEIIEKYNIGRRLFDVNKVAALVEEILADDHKILNQMKENAKKLARPNAAEEICQWTAKKFSENNLAEPLSS
ncbi:MAG: UDP-N-acetylglucosamine 2-epimerase [Candidatus Omnitrophica bacterium]|nr:UDP-N-acetylglucosamine 2-epimerase [Candidatus Omnitrophota bacterium]